MRLALIAVLAIGCGAAHAPPVEHDDPPDAGPVIDRDRDGVADDVDLCPCDAEDLDGWQDENGCPDLDNDGDRIVDACDLCPNEPETYNGGCDEDGCPDHGHVCIEPSRIAIVASVTFARRSATPDAASTAVLDAIAATMAGNPMVTLVAVVGETDRDEPQHARLALRRAEAVRDALIVRGVPRDRLVAEASTASVAPSEEPGLHRRVLFEVRSIDGAPVDPTPPELDTTSGCTPPAPCEVPVCNPTPPAPAC